MWRRSGLGDGGWSIPYCRGGDGRAEVEHVWTLVASSHVRGRWRGRGVVVATRRIRVLRADRTKMRSRTSPSRRSSIAWHSSHSNCPTRLKREDMSEPVLCASPPVEPGVSNRG
jgi:hypothetical protein